MIRESRLSISNRIYPFNRKYSRRPFRRAIWIAFGIEFSLYNGNLDIDKFAIDKFLEMD
jgi:hypothetical protein